VPPPAVLTLLTFTVTYWALLTALSGTINAGETFEIRAAREAAPVNQAAPAFGKRKAVLYATCFVNFNNTDIGAAARAVLARNGVETEVVYPACCGMPKLELGDIEAVAAAARQVTAALLPWVDKGYDVIALTPSCALMLKFEWPLILPKDPAVERLSQATFDVSEYVVDIAKKDGLAPGLEPIEGGVSVHLACHARAQNMGAKAAEMLRLVPKTRVTVIERRNARALTRSELPYGAEVIVIDVSFISLGKVLAAALACAAERFDCLALVKPQFEVGRGRIGKGGVVREAPLRREALLQAGISARDLGASVLGYASSGLPGPKGNLETFVWLAEGGRPGIEDLEAAVLEVEP